MQINTSSNEGSTHIGLKLKVIELLSERDDLLEMATEYLVEKDNGYYNSVDVFAKKKDGGNIYVEVKSEATLPEAIGQLIRLDKGNGNDEFIAVCNFKKPYFLKNLWRNKYLDWQEFINKTKVYIFNEDLELQHIDICFKDGKELWIDGEKII